MAPALVEIPLLASSERFLVSLAGVQYRFSVLWRESDAGGSWYLDIADASGAPIVSGIALVMGVDLLGQYEYLKLGGSLVLNSLGDVLPTYTNLGTGVRMYFATAA